MFIWGAALGFENIFKGMVKEGANRSEFVLRSKERPHISRAKIDIDSNARCVGTGSFLYSRYTSELDERYVAAAHLTYDLLFSMHELKTGKSIIYRPFQEAGLLGTAVRRKVEALGSGANIEARVIGMQNGQGLGIVQEISDFIIANGIRLVEVDLFGGDTRHIAIDAKLGTSFNILMEDRIYRPGELGNPMTMENFEAELAANNAKSKKEKASKI